MKSALKLGKREYNACVNKGKYPYLPVMESMMRKEVQRLQERQKLLTGMITGI